MHKLKTDYLPDLQSNDHFENIVFTEVLSNNEPNMRTYSIQVFCSGLPEMKLWKDDFQPRLESISGSFAGKVLFFHSKMRVID